MLPAGGASRVHLPGAAGAPPLLREGLATGANGRGRFPESAPVGWPAKSVAMHPSPPASGPIEQRGPSCNRRPEKSAS